MKVEVLYFEGCPHHRPAVAQMREVLQEEGVSAQIIKAEVLDQATAQAVNFLGSPTIKINGVDVEPEARTSQAFAVACRTYRSGGRQEGLPAKEMIRAAVREALGQPAGGQDCCAQPPPSWARRRR
ncbi:MAG: DF family (seleno)protein [Bryobacteraceae bacterium]